MAGVTQLFLLVVVLVVDFGVRDDEGDGDSCFLRFITFSPGTTLAIYG
jgi:hypothetical protein